MTRQKPSNDTLPLPSEDERFRNNWILWVALLLFSAIKMRGYWLNGRFWAEEGQHFYSDIAALPGFEGFFYLFNHHLELVTNTIVWIATRVEFYHAPLITTYLSWLIQLLPVGLIIHYRQALGLSFYRTMLLLLVICGIPQSPEVWANSINLHFHFALLAALIALIPIISDTQKWLFRGLLLIAGLSGIPANCLAPVFLVMAWRHRDQEKAVQLAILATTSALQIGLLLSHGSLMEGRETSTTPMVVWLALVAQHLVSPLFGKVLGSHVLKQLPLLDQDSAKGWAIAAFITVGYVALWYSSFRQRNTLAIYSLLAGFLLAMFCILTSLGDRTTLISIQGGGRYFFAPNVLLSLAILLLIPKRPGRYWRSILILWALILLQGTRSYISGPPWPVAYTEGFTQKQETIDIWPKGWKVKNHALKPPETTQVNGINR